jgi:hypothetical protein
VPQLTDNERVTLALIAAAAYERSLVRAERHEAELVSCIEGEHYGAHHCQRSQLTRWERIELAHMNSGRAEPLYSLPDAAYEARRLTRYCRMDD